jgi:transcriptional regulator with XRE-family HTH domain
MRYVAGRLSPDFWSAPAVAGALARCDFPVLLEEIRRARGWTQAELADEVGYSQSWVSKVMRGKQVLTIDQAREVSRRLGIPVHLLRFGLGGEDPAKRRDFGKAVALAVLAWPRLTETDERVVPALAGVTRAQRRLDATMCARELAPGVVAHVEMANRMLARTRDAGLSVDMAAALSEAAGFAAWLHADMCDLGTARTYYRLAIGAARQAGHDLLAGYMLGSLAGFEIDNGDHVTGLALIAKAREQISGSEHPAPPTPGWLPLRRWVMPRDVRTAVRLTKRLTGPVRPLRTVRPRCRPRGRGCSRSITPSWRATGHLSVSGLAVPVMRSPRSLNPWQVRNLPRNSVRW